jgi:hypothetical protein
MFFGMMDQKNSLIKKVIGNDKIDPGCFSFMESGWWALHSALITGVFLLGYKMSQRNKV